MAHKVYQAENLTPEGFRHSEQISGGQLAYCWLHTLKRDLRQEYVENKSVDPGLTGSTSLKAPH